KSIKLFFASPNVPNSEVFLQLFEKSTSETMSIKESPVSQNRFFLDLIDGHIKYFSDLKVEINLPISKEFQSTKFNDWLYKLGSNCKNIIYCNTVGDTINYAIGFAETLQYKESDKIDELIRLIKEYIHKDYFLIDCLKKGVAFHFGRLPQRIRERIEELFREKIIDYVFCTSTLLEGVNLPAKNIFILSNAIGPSKFTDIDFWNLAGRAGRLTKELSGNIICARIENKRNRWDNINKDLEVVKNKNIQKIEPLLIKGQDNFYKNLGKSLKNEVFTDKNASQEKINIWKHYANIALIHEITKDESVLKSNFIKKNSQAKDLLKTSDKLNKIPEKILILSSTIKAEYQNQIWEQDNLSEYILPENIDYITCFKFLNVLFDKYNWAEEESGGHNPMAKYRERLEYFSRLMSNWMNSTPLNQIIINLIKYYENKGQIWDTNRNEYFVKGDKRQINLIINSLISDIDNILRFKLKNYFLNYYLILKEKLGEENAGANWAEFLEYGTTDKRIIELQNVGFPRHLSKYIIENHSDCLEFNDGVLTLINEDKLKQRMNTKEPEYKEMLRVLP
ncbi:MAG: helicase-related protein, partial [Bacteroidota bacterium]|nr:helicase-related protein [Bacteroidota bacterium]